MASTCSRMAATVASARDQALAVSVSRNGTPTRYTSSFAFMPTLLVGVGKSFVALNLWALRMLILEDGDLGLNAAVRVRSFLAR